MGLLFMMRFKKSLVYRDIQLLQQLLPCIIKTLNIIEPNISRHTPQLSRKQMFTSNIFVKSQHETVLLQILNDLNYITQNDIIRIYTKEIQPLLERMGILLTVTLKQLLGSLFRFLDISDKQIRIYTLDCLKIVIKKCWPRIGYHKGKLVQALVGIYLISADSLEYELKSKTTETFNTLKSVLSIPEFNEVIAVLKEISQLHALVSEL